MPAARRNVLFELLFRVHPWIYRKSGGRILSKMGPSPILLLDSVGRKSGAPRTNAIMYLETESGWVVAASYAGEPKHPAWYWNVTAHPDVTIQVRDRVIPVTARETQGEERDSLWQRIVAQDPSFAVYEERTRGVREIPVVVFESRDS
jgi:deazaflavin-dependent oxidoreductase (nitroreductase family)